MKIERFNNLSEFYSSKSDQIAIQDLMKIKDLVTDLWEKIIFKVNTYSVFYKNTYEINIKLVDTITSETCDIWKDFFDFFQNLNLKWQIKNNIFIVRFSDTSEMLKELKNIKDIRNIK